ncbi:methyltransferase domain-containing protein [Candidatus Parcubacteria bacterium]|nr:methyltransferase domain-containing protein [Candidatus Parcubacteria bacterium]
MPKQRTSLSISVRRHFVDQFFFSHSSLFKSGVEVIDIGGKKVGKRGLFDIGKLSAHVTYVNIEEKDAPDIIADASSIPVADSSYDIALAGELMEHVPNPSLVLKEAYRLLKPGGKLLITVPFLYPVHADPFDYGRYTDYYWQRASDSTGFKSIHIERQGAVFAVAALMVQHIFRAKQKSWSPIQNTLVKFFMWLDSKTASPLLKAWTTGYGIILTK